MMKNTRRVLSACCLAMLSVGDNSTAVMAALPAMTRDLHLDAAAVEWVVNAYLLAAAVFILLGGEAADRFGARRSSTAGIALFALASLIIALAPSGIVVIAARAPFRGSVRPSRSPVLSPRRQSHLHRSAPAQLPPGPAS
jgi:MFS family permease